MGKIKEQLKQAAGFVRDNWKELLLLGSLTAVAALLSSKDSSGVENSSDNYSDNLNDRGTSRTNFSKRWLRNATDAELSSEREKVRLKYVNSSIDEADNLYNTLHRFDAEMIDRANTKYEQENPDAKPRHREHGWYLPNDD